MAAAENVRSRKKIKKRKRKLLPTFVERLLTCWRVLTRIRLNFSTAIRTAAPLLRRNFWLKLPRLLVYFQLAHNKNSNNDNTSARFSFQHHWPATRQLINHHSSPSIIIIFLFLTSRKKQKNKNLFVSYFESYNADTYNTTRRQSTATVSPVHIARPPPLPSTSYVKHFQKIKILPRPNTRHTPTACHPLKDEWPDRGSMSWNKKKNKEFFFPAWVFSLTSQQSQKM